MTLTSALDISRRTRPPRAAFLNFPLGNQVGPPGEPELQREILRSTLEVLVSAKRPGEIVQLPYEWPDKDWQATVIATYRADAATVLRQRRESEFEGADNFAERDCIDVCSLI